MRRGGAGSGAPIALILALVFPAIIAAALALAYYGFLYVDSISGPTEAVYHADTRSAVTKVVAELETRVDEPARALFQRLAAERREPTLRTLCDVEPGPAISWYVILDGKAREECRWGVVGSRTAQAELTAASAKLDGRPVLDWKAVRLDSWNHYHSPDGALLIVFTARKTDDDQRYYVAARLKMTTVRSLLDEALGPLRENRRVVVMAAQNGSIVSGSPIGAMETERQERLRYEDPALGKALYSWKLEAVPKDATSFLADAERRKRLRPILIVLSTSIIAVGLGAVWLVILSERRASRLKSDFIANVSHELKTPLSLIRMFGELVASGRHKGEGAAREYGAIITRESERLSHLIDNVLDFARLERGKASYDFAEGDLAEVLERALDVCRYRLDKEKLILRTYIEPALPPVRMDENAMTLVILNLVDNAIKHGAEGGSVDVTLQRIPGGVVLAVRDHGSGVAREEQTRIFERFYRARSARDRNVRGSGIGLALVKYIAEAHGGRVTVESPVTSAGPASGPGGALFRVFLPAPVSAGAESSDHHTVAPGDRAVDPVRS